VGANGSGKSTLLHTLAGELPPLRGSVSRGPRTEARLYRQDLRSTDGDGAEDAERRSVREDLIASHPTSAERARTILGALLFSGDDSDKLVAELSGGERARLLLGKLALHETNLLLLDEPTNHLDIPTQEVLEAALLRYAGSVVLVTHDRALIDSVATRTWSIEDEDPEDAAPRRVREVLGGYSELIRVRDRERRDEQRRAAAPASTPHRAGHRSARGSEARALEEEITQVETQLKAVKQRLLDPGTFADPAGGAEAGREHDRLTGALAELYERWAELAAQAGEPV
jgi:ATP-binding cassette subfamily F protein 3